MLYASLVQCPVFGGTLKSVDDSKLSGMPGVRKVVKLSNAVAVVADSWWRAKTAAEAIKISWDDGGNGNTSTESITEFVRAGLSAPDAGVGRKQGDVAAGLAKAAKRIDAEYQTPFLAHATMEPQNCTAHVIGDKAEIWASTQDAERSMKFAAQALGIALDNIVLHPTLVGGGFGRRGAPQDFITYAALVAKEVEAPVKVLWSREEDVQHDFYRTTFYLVINLTTAGPFGLEIASNCSLAPTVQLLRCMSPLLAQSGHSNVCRQCPLLTQSVSTVHRFGAS
jgi:isoquinoline 1-oxidoreductase subunit beta